MGQHKYKHFHSDKENPEIPKLFLKLFLIGTFLFLSYNYFLRNSMDAFVTRIVQLPFIYQLVEGWVYWAMILILTFLIWKLVDFIINLNKSFFQAKILWGLVIGVIILILFFGHNIGLIKIKFNDSYCKENIIPERIILNEGLASSKSSIISQGSEYYINFAGTWKDGSEIKGNIGKYDFMNTEFSSSCHQGYKEGENVNYIYCDNLHYYKSTQSINKEGVIGRKIEKKYSISLILKPEGSWKYTDTIQFGDLEEFYDLGKEYLQAFGEVWVENAKYYPNEPEVYRNYSIVSYRCSYN